MPSSGVDVARSATWRAILALSDCFEPFRQNALVFTSLHLSCILQVFLTAPRNCPPPPVPCSLAPRSFFSVRERSSKAAPLIPLRVDFKVHLESIEEDMGEMKRRLCQEFNFCRPLQSICVHVQPCCLKKLLALGRCRIYERGTPGGTGSKQEQRRRAGERPTKGCLHRKCLYCRCFF